MIVVAIIGILAAIAIPKFSNLIIKGHEASTKGNLGGLRSALAIYYSDMEGSYPTDTLQVLRLNGKYLSYVISPAKFPQVAGFNTGHPDSNTVLGQTSVDDTGGWVYDNIATDGNWGTLLANCSHSDSKGSFWTSY